jgi:hypothetical protein
MILGEIVQYQHHLTACGGIDDFVNSHEGKVIFWTTLVQVYKIYAHSPFTILFAHHHNVF